MTNHPLAVYGSCVSRDLLAYLPYGDSPSVYVARQSLISAMSRPIRDYPQPVLTSAFQKRMVCDDIESRAVERIMTVQARSRLLLMDLVDERFGVLEVGPSRYVTPSFEFLQAGDDMTAHFAEARHIAFGTEEHWALWTRAVGRFMKALRQSGLNRRMRLLDPAWAERGVAGEQMGKVLDRTPAEWNGEFRRYSDFLNQRGVVRVRLTEEEVRGSSEHQWGLAPFHYSEETSRLLAQRLRASLRKTRQRP